VKSSHENAEIDQINARSKRQGGNVCVMMEFCNWLFCF